LICRGAEGYFQWVQNYYQQHGILPDLREPLFMAMAVFSALPISNIVLSSINNYVPELRSSVVIMLKKNESLSGMRF